MNKQACKAFLKVADKFKLGELQTEQPHPLTIQLSQDAQKNLNSAIASLKEVDCEALEQLKAFLPNIADLGRSIHETLKAGGNLYLCGCGATGRLSISLETFCRQGLVTEEYKDRFIGFMAGGDTALFKSIENFEDYPEYGERQLLELGFSDKDLLISTTEGGETPFVIGATEAATAISNRNPWFLYCNPEKQLIQQVERSARVIENPAITSLSLYVGPMGLSGSTRMQASTVLMAAVGWAIGCGNDLSKLEERLSKLEEAWRNLDLFTLSDFTKAESECYNRGEFIIYETDVFAVTVLTDTTERSPTFSLPAFENDEDPSDPPAWCYLSIPTAESLDSAWKAVLERSPRCLEWDGINSFTGRNYLNGFHIDQTCPSKRIEKTNHSKQHRFSITAIENGFRMEFMEYHWNVLAPNLSNFELNLLLKMLLNIHSTLVMGLLERFESNLMTYVKPTNFKLIDRTIRYVQRLSILRGQKEVGYEQVAEKLFEIKDTLPPEEPVVLRVLEALIKS